MSKILITSGPTREYLDPVRYLTNASSGRMGAALAQACLEAGYDVVVVSGPVDIEYPRDAERVFVTSTQEMHVAAMQHFRSCVGAIGAAAPCDFKPIVFSKDKISKENLTRAPGSNGGWSLPLCETPDVMAALGEMKRKDDAPDGWQWLVAFALETSDHHIKALQKLQRKHCDLIVVNGPASINGLDTSVDILDVQGNCLARSYGRKIDVARKLVSTIQEFVQNRQNKYSA